MTTSNITHSALCELLDYSPLSGQFVWRVKSGRAFPGKLAGTKHSNGYWVVGIEGRQYRAHRLAWFFMFGRWPLGEIDHVDGNPLNNAIGNLREATRQQNLRNRKSTRGVSIDPRCRARPYQARIIVNRSMKSLGFFETYELARKAYLEAANELHGEFSQAAQAQIVAAKEILRVAR